MPDFGIMRGFSDKLFSDKLVAGQLPTSIGNTNPSNKFIFSVDTRYLYTGSTTRNQFKLPLVSSTAINITVEWGDGLSDNITVWNAATTTHTYTTPGVYIIEISGTLRGFQFNGGGDRLKVINLFNYGCLEINTIGTFNGCGRMTQTAIDAPLITTTSLQSTFLNCNQFNGNVGNWNVTNVTSFLQMFSGASIFNNAGVDSIKNWNVSNATQLGGMFTNSSFNQPIGNWNTSKVTELSAMFNGSTFNQDISKWNTSNVTAMNSMFIGNNAFNQPIGSWDVGKVTTFTSMFQACKFNQDISKWNMSSATNITNMFRANTNFNQPIGSWNTSKITSLDNIFFGATSFDQNIGSWNITLATTGGGIMLGKDPSSFVPDNLDAIYIGWSAQAVKPNLSINFGSIKYTASGVAARAILTSAPNNWTITDGGLAL